MLSSNPINNTSPLPMNYLNPSITGQEFTIQNQFDNATLSGVEIVQQEMARRNNLGYGMGRALVKLWRSEFFATYIHNVHNKCYSLVKNTLKKHNPLINQETSFLGSLINKVRVLFQSTPKELASEEAAERQLAPYKRIAKSKILKSLKEAKKMDKPLLVLLGEVHDTWEAEALELIVLEATSEIAEFNLKHYFTELPNDALCFKKDQCTYFSLTAELMGLKSIFVDILECGDDGREYLLECKNIEGDPCSHENQHEKNRVRNRNSIMAMAMRTLKHKGHSVAIVGAAHLYGLERETDLAQDFHIVSFDVSPAQYYKNMEELIHKMANRLKNQDALIGQKVFSYYVGEVEQKLKITDYRKSINQYISESGRVKKLMKADDTFEHDVLYSFMYKKCLKSADLIQGTMEERKEKCTYLTDEARKVANKRNH